jgi:predicted GTPase
VLPAVVYSAEQVAALRQTIEQADAGVVIAATPVDLERLLGLDAIVDRWLRDTTAVAPARR